MQNEIVWIRGNRNQALHQPSFLGTGESWLFSVDSDSGELKVFNWTTANQLFIKVRGDRMNLLDRILFLNLRGRARTSWLGQVEVSLASGLMEIWTRGGRSTARLLATLLSLHHLTSVSTVWSAGPFCQPPESSSLASTSSRPGWIVLIFNDPECVRW